jgi:hypothetical protein
MSNSNHSALPIGSSAYVDTNALEDPKLKVWNMAKFFHQKKKKTSKKSPQFFFPTPVSPKIQKQSSILPIVIIFSSPNKLTHHDAFLSLFLPCSAVDSPILSGTLSYIRCLPKSCYITHSGRIFFSPPSSSRIFCVFSLLSVPIERAVQVETYRKTKKDTIPTPAGRSRAETKGTRKLEIREISRLVLFM